MDYEKFYKDVCAVVAKEYEDPADFANDVLAIVRASNTCLQPNTACSGLAVFHREFWNGNELVCLDCGESL
ncbi:MAG: hypothetical protein IPN27_11565 [Cellvibrionales bacterium]|nr:hypothetical protein [Cellvibrionales bacterium]